MTTDKPEPMMSVEDAVRWAELWAEPQFVALIRSLDERARKAEAERDAARKDASFIAYWQGQTHEQRERAIKAEAQVAEQAKEIKELKNKMDDADRYIEMKGVAKR